jgi:hypothetical protein
MHQPCRHRDHDRRGHHHRGVVRNRRHRRRERRPVHRDRYGSHRHHHLPQDHRGRGSHRRRDQRDDRHRERRDDPRDQRGDPHRERRDGPFRAAGASCPGWGGAASCPGSGVVHQGRPFRPAAVAYRGGRRRVPAQPQLGPAGEWAGGCSASYRRRRRGCCRPEVRAGDRPDRVDRVDGGHRPAPVRAPAELPQTRPAPGARARRPGRRGQPDRVLLG